MSHEILSSFFFCYFKQTWQKCARRDRNYVCGQITDLSFLIGLDQLMAPTHNSTGIQCEVPVSRGLAKLGAFQVVYRCCEPRIFYAKCRLHAAHHITYAVRPGTSFPMNLRSTCIMHELVMPTLSSNQN